jgi:hypothetical protein
MIQSSSIAAIPFLVLWFLFVLANAMSFYRNHVSKRFTSSIPLLGGLFGVVGFLQIPELKNWCWVAVLVDYGSINFLLALPKITKELWQTSRVNLVREFAGKDGGKEVRIRLYKAGVFTIKHSFTRAKDELGLIASSDIGSWSKMEGVIVLALRNDAVPLRQLGEVWKIDRSFAHYAKDGDLGIEPIDLIETR